MRNAFAISCWKPNLFHLQQAVACTASIRERGCEEDVIILTLDEKSVSRLKRATRNYDVSVRLCEKIPHREPNRLRSHACLLDVNKLYYWSLAEYDNVLGIDCDCILTKKIITWSCYDKFTVFNGGKTGPVCAAVMNLKPNMNTFHEMTRLYHKSTFDYESGWNECGPIKGVEGWNEPHWRFQSSDSLQGFVIYYWHCLKNNFWTNLNRPFGVIHHAGNQKRSDWYLRHMRRLIGGQMTI